MLPKSAFEHMQESNGREQLNSVGSSTAMNCAQSQNFLASKTRFLTVDQI